LGGLGINFGFLVAQIVNFLILLIVLQKWVYPRVLNMLEQRRERIRSSMEEAEEARRRAALAEEEYQKRVDEARREADSIIRRATEQAEQVRQDILAKGKRGGSRAPSTSGRGYRNPAGPGADWDEGTGC